MPTKVNRWKVPGRERVDVWFETELSGMLSADVNLVGVLNKVVVGTIHAVDAPVDWTVVSAAGAFNVLLIEPDTEGNNAVTDVLMGYCSDVNATSTEVVHPRVDTGASDNIGLPVHGRYMMTVSDGATAGTEAVGVVRLYLEQ